jgi:peptide/nickel transport system permease protein
MSTVTVPSAAALKVPGFWRRALHHRSFVIGAVLTPAAGARRRRVAGVDALVALRHGHGQQAAAALGSHWLGTDTFGRDVASLLLVGARASILVGVIAVGIGLVVGTALGLLAAAKRGWVEEAIMRLTDFSLRLPRHPVGHHADGRVRRGHRERHRRHRHLQHPDLRAHHARLGQRHLVARVRAAARACGKGASPSPCSTCCRTSRPVLIVQITIRFAIAILAEAALSYLGLGTQPPQPSWGRMLSEAQTMMFQSPLLAVFPGMAIAFAVLGLNLLGDGLRDLLDPRLARARCDKPHATSPSQGPPHRTADATRPRRGRARHRLHAGARRNAGHRRRVGLRQVDHRDVAHGPAAGRAKVTGSIRFDDTELVGRDEKSMCQIRGNRIGMIFQEPMTALNPVHTIVRQVGEPLRLHRGLSKAEARKEVLALLERVGIPDAASRLDAYPHQFSGGQRQRIGIAMALACGPDLLIADEPTTALDVTIQKQILELIQSLVAERGMALILISHDLGVIAQTSPRCW